MSVLVFYDIFNIMYNFSELNREELNIFKRLNTPKKLQDFINAIPINFDKGKDTLMSPRRVLRENRAHCLEGAFLAAAVLWFHGQKPLLMDLKSLNNDYDHVVTLFRKDNHWGAISKTNHAVLRYREPIYESPRELAMSYFHEYFLDDGKKTMRSYSKPFDLSRFAKGKANWLIAEDDLWDIGTALDDSPHFPILTRSMVASLRRADDIEIEAGKLVEYKK